MLKPPSSCERIRNAIRFLPTESFRLNLNDSIGSVVLAASSSARASLFARYGPSIGPRLALASSCERIRDAIPFLPTESFRPVGTLSSLGAPIQPARIESPSWNEGVPKTRQRSLLVPEAISERISARTHCDDPP